MDENPTDTIQRPCIGNCCLDEHDICMGCFRSLAEIVGWSEASNDERREILRQCQRRSLEYVEKRRNP